MPGGFSGVDVFFVISGYVVSGSLARESQDSFRQFVTGFYARRILRIYPALVTCLIATALLQTLLVPASWLSTASGRTAISAFFGFSNYAMVWFSDGYFAPRAEFNAFTHTWSLAVEEQFYLLFPLIFLPWLRSRDRPGLWGAVTRWMLPVLLTASFAFSSFQTGSAPERAFYLLPGRFWELACGAVLFQLHTRGRFIAVSRFWGNVLVLSGLALIGFGCYFARPASFPFPWAIPAVAGALFVIAGVAATGSLAVDSILGNSAIVHLGKMSYSLYLWHWPILVIFRWTAGLESPLAILSAIVLIVLASAASYRFIEGAVRQSQSVKSTPARQIVMRGVAAIAASALIAVGILAARPYLSLSVTKDRSEWYPEAWPSPNTAPQQPAPQFRNRKLFVLGDSHTEAYSTMLRILRDKDNVPVRQYSMIGCPVAGLLAVTSLDCALYIERTIATIKSEGSPGDIVFLASLRVNRLSDQWAPVDGPDAERAQHSSESVAERSGALREAASVIDSLEKASLRVIIDAPKPIFRSPPFRCSDWFNSGNPVCRGGSTMERAFLLRYRQPAMESLQSLAEEHPELIVWDPFPVLCPGEICLAYDSRHPVFFDGDHLSAYGNRMLYPSFVSLLQTLWQSAL